MALSSKLVPVFLTGMFLSSKLITVLLASKAVSGLLSSKLLAVITISEVVIVVIPAVESTRWVVVPLASKAMIYMMFLIANKGCSCCVVSADSKALCCVLMLLLLIAKAMVCCCCCVVCGESKAFCMVFLIAEAVICWCRVVCVQCCCCCRWDRLKEVWGSWVRCGGCYWGLSNGSRRGVGRCREDRGSTRWTHWVRSTNTAKWPWTGRAWRAVPKTSNTVNKKLSISKSHCIPHCHKYTHTCRPM